MLAIILAAPFVALLAIGIGSSALRKLKQRQRVKQWHEHVAQQLRAEHVHRQGRRLQ